MSRTRAFFVFFAVSLQLALPQLSRAGARDLELLLNTAGGRAVLSHLGLPTAEARLAESLGLEQIARAEAQLVRVRESFLQARPAARDAFVPGSLRGLTELESRALLQILGQEEVSALRQLQFVEARPAAAGVSASRAARQSFLHPVAQAQSVPAQAAARTAERAVQLREILKDFVAASLPEGAAARAEKMREAVARHPDLAAWYLEGEDLGALLKASDLDMGPGFDPQQVVKQMSRDQFRSLLEGTALQESLEGLGNTAIDLATQRGSTKALGLVAVEQFKRLPVATRIQLLRQLGDEPFAVGARGIDRQIEQVRVSEVPAVKQIFDPAGGIDLSQFPKDKAALFEGVLTRYFDQMAIEDKKKIVLALLELPAGAAVETKLGAVLQNSGPAAQKLFQLVGRDAKSPLVHRVMKELLSNIKPVEWSTVRALVEAELGRPIDQVFSYFSTEPLAAASVGQVHRAVLKSTGQPVVVKVLKPGVREQAIREIETLKSIIGDTTFERDLVANIEDALMKELDLRIEAQNLLKGLGYVSHQKGIAIAGSVQGVPATSNLLVQQMARGTVLSKLSTPMEIAERATGRFAGPYDKKLALKELTERGDALERLMSQWFERAIYGDGFFHADLHPGNLFYLPDPASRTKPMLTMIDFGSADALTVAQRRGFIQFSIATAMKSPDQALIALRRFSEIPPGSEEAYRRGLQELFGQNLSVVERVQQGFLLSVQHEMRIPREIFMFTRGDLFLEKQILEVNRALDLLDPAGKVGRYSPILSYLKVSSKHAALETPINSLRLLPRRARNAILEFFGREVDPRVSPEIFNDDTLEGVWAASREAVLASIR